MSGMDWTQVVVAFLALAGVVTTAFLAAGNRRTTGKANGEGTVVQMAERTLIEVGKIHGRLDRQDDVLDTVDLRLTRLEKVHGIEDA